MAIGDKEVWSRDTSQDIQENVGLVNDLDLFTSLRRVRRGGDTPKAHIPHLLIEALSVKVEVQVVRTVRPPVPKFCERKRPDLQGQVSRMYRLGGASSDSRG